MVELGTWWYYVYDGECKWRVQRRHFTYLLIIEGHKSNHISSSSNFPWSYQPPCLYSVVSSAFSDQPNVAASLTEWHWHCSSLMQNPRSEWATESFSQSASQQLNRVNKFKVCVSLSRWSVAPSKPTSHQKRRRSQQKELVGASEEARLVQAWLFLEMRTEKAHYK